MVDKAWSFKRLSSLAQGQQSTSVLGPNETTHVLQVKPVGCTLVLLRVSWSQGFVYGYVFGNVSLQSCSQLLSPASVLYSWQNHLCNRVANPDKGNYSYEREPGNSESSFSASLFAWFPSQRDCTDASGGTEVSRSRRGKQRWGQAGAVQVKVHDSTVGLHHIVYFAPGII